MNYYHIWCDLLDTHKAHEFCQAVNEYLGWLKEKKLVEGHKVTRRKLGFGPPELGEFHIIIETKDLEQLERNFQTVAKNEQPVARLHANVYSRVKNFRSGLWRDYPDVF